MGINKKLVKEYLFEPFKALKNVKNLTYCAMLLALSVLSAYIMSFYPTNYIKISITFIFIAIIAMKFGPAIAGIVAAAADIIQCVTHPVGPYQPLLTVGAALSGIIFGVLLYHNKTNLWRIIVSKATISLFISSLFDTYAISLLYGIPFVSFFIPRIIKNAIAFPIEVFLIVTVISLVKKLDKKI